FLSFLVFLFLMLPPPPRSSLFPYTTLFRSGPISFKVPPPGIFLCLIRSFGSSIPRNISSKLRSKSSNQLLVGNLQRLLNHSGNNSSSSNRFHLLVSVII